MSLPLQPLSLRHDLGDAISGRYIVKQVLGAGAFGTVYRVEETLGARIVTRACKEMHGLDDPATNFDERADALRMFQEEAFLLETLRHPNIPAAHFEPNAGTWLACPVCGRCFKGVRDCPDHGAPLQVVRERYYLLMDFIEGADLEETLVSQNGRPLDETPVLDWMLQVCDALEFVHRAGFSHRDIKPANIKIQSATQRAMLIDFGLVKPSNVAGTYGTVLKRKSTVLGTLGYAPPTLDEQRMPDARTDILALGMTMYRLLTGRDPTLEDDLALMRRSSPRDLNASISPEVSMIIARMIAPDPDKRFPNVEELRRELQAARYPVEVSCPHCGEVNRFPGAPPQGARCKRCGREVSSGAATSPGTSSRVSGLGPVNGAQGARLAPPRTGTTVLNTPQVAPPQVPRINPYDARLRALRTELTSPPPAPTSDLDARIAEAEKLLKSASVLATGVPVDSCPNCQRAKLSFADGSPTGACPLCLGAQLERRPLDPNKCPCCHEIALKRGHLPPKELFCPVCREVPLREETRSRALGIVADVWWNCPHCHAEFDEGRHRVATLMNVPQDPFGVGAAMREKNLPFDEWRRMSGRTDEYIACDHCGANWNMDSPDSATLLHAGEGDAGKEWKSRALPMEAWQKIAENLPPDAGTHACPRCRAEFDVDRAQGNMALLQFGSARPAWAQSWTGQWHALREWYLHASGKTTGQPGAVCPNCATEWDAAENGLHLSIAKPGPLVSRVGDTLALEDWQRLARGAPTRQEAARLRQELGGLQMQRADEVARAAHDAQSRRHDAEQELLILLKKSVLEGYAPLQRIGGAPTQIGMFVALARHLPHSALRAGETLRWECQATRCRAQVFPGSAGWGWMRDGVGTFMLSDERGLFVLPPGSAILAPGASQVAWQRSLTGLRAVDLQNVQGSYVIALEFGQNDLWGFEMSPMTWPLHWDGAIYNLLITPNDLVQILRERL